MVFLPLGVAHGCPSLIWLQLFLATRSSLVAAKVALSLFLDSMTCPEAAGHSRQEAVHQTVVLEASIFAIALARACMGARSAATADLHLQCLDVHTHACRHYHLLATMTDNYPYPWLLQDLFSVAHPAQACSCSTHTANLVPDWQGTAQKPTAQAWVDQWENVHA